ncbi:hypothetical protein [uncultured Draconibacterium sp.]|uniref:hypothetical protein n=1 Tax=uncultured Draconibacterium sp. TaxID=1573823 RepID=UPI003216A5B2
MEAIFKIEPKEFNEELFQRLKKLFEGKTVTIAISTEMDETDYLMANSANRKHLLENMVQESTVRFTPEKFDKHFEKLVKDS